MAGWAGDPEPLRQAGALCHNRRKRWKRKWKGFNARHWLACQQPANLGHYFLVGLYGLMINLFASFSLNPNFLVGHSTFFYMVVMTSMVVAALLMTYPAWPTFAQGRTVEVWGYPLAIGVLFFVTPLLFLLMSGLNLGALFLYMSTFVVGLYLLTWPLVVLFSLSGLILSMLVYHCGVQSLSTLTGPSMQLDAYMCTMFAVSVFVVWAISWLQQRRWNQLNRYYRSAEERGQRYARKNE